MSLLRLLRSEIFGGISRCQNTLFRNQAILSKIEFSANLFQQINTLLLRGETKVTVSARQISISFFKLKSKQRREFKDAGCL